MSNVDEFESIFRSALKDRFVLEHNPPKTILVLTDLNVKETASFDENVKKFLSVFDHTDIKWMHISGKDYSNITDLLKQIDKQAPDLICTYRNLHSDAWNFPHSLGEYVDVLTQKTSAPVFIFPHPKADYAAKHAMKHTHNVMVMTDHLSTEHRLVNVAINLTEENGTLHLVHIEDEFYFKRVIDAVSKIPTIDTDDAEMLIQGKLLKDADDYITSCQEVLAEAGSRIKVKKEVRFGRHLKECKRIIDRNKVDVLVINSKAEGQQAMHSLAYPLAVEIRNIPVLML